MDLLKFFLAVTFLLMAYVAESKQKAGHGLTDEPLRVGVIGLVHDHVHWILGRPERGDIQIVGIVEPDQQLVSRFVKRYGFDRDIVFDSIEEMLEKTKPQAVTAFNTIYGHLEVVEKCAPRGIHIMVEKPLAVSLDHAREMKRLAEKHRVHLLTNYETSWYASNHRAFQMIAEGNIGELRKIVVHDGHPGPREIGCSEEFLEWLTDPKFNGGGALTDFGCYGANLSTWLMKGQRPLSVFAVTQQIKPDVYPLVDDEATIVLTYPKAQAIIQASWNWPYHRKDMDIYGSTGYIRSLDRSNMSILTDTEQGPFNEQAPALPSPYDDPFAYLAALVKGTIDIAPADLSSLENNMIVVEILEAAGASARSGKRVFLGDGKSGSH